MARQITLHHPSGRLGVKTNPFGKDVANAGLFRALIGHEGFERVHLTAAIPVRARDLAADAPPAPGMTLTTGAIGDPAPLRETGTLLRGQPHLTEFAWTRRRHGDDAAWSLVGLIHTLGPPASRMQMVETLMAPVQPWDAMVCTSPAVAEVMGAMFDGWTEHLHARFGGDLRPRPRLPVIPLGVDAPALAAARHRGEARARLRARLGVPDDGVLIVWVGRLSFFEKAFPQPMFRAVAEAAGQVGDTPVHFAMAGWFPGGDEDRRRYEQAARAYAPGVPLSLLDGNDRELTADLWSAADIFLSLVDNIQETFGITPVEAMAAGLPVVVSDWDGYRSTVRDGIDGMLAPTLGGPAGPLGEIVAERHGLELESYQAYVGGVAQHTAVDVAGAARALAALIADEGLRRRMGAAGQANVRERFDWPVIARSYAELVDELAERRTAGASPSAPRLNPARGDPFADFASFATEVISPGTLLRLRESGAGRDLERISQVELDRAFPHLRGSEAETRALLSRLSDGATQTAHALLADVPDSRRPALMMTLAWLCKLGVLDWRAPGAPA